MDRWWRGSGSHAFLYSDGDHYEILGCRLPGATSNLGNAINDHGQIVGAAEFDSPNSLPVSHAVLFEGGKILDLNSQID